MPSWILTNRYAFPNTISCVVAAGETAVMVQLDDALVHLDLERRRTSMLAPLEPGSNLVSASADGTRTCFDNAGNIIRYAADGGILGTTALGAEVEFVDARATGDALAILVAESVGEPMGLGVARFSFISQKTPSNEPQRLPPAWRSRPRYWIVDRAGDRLIAFFSDGRPVAVSLSSGVDTDAPVGFGSESRRHELTGAAVTPNGRLVKTLWSPEDRRGELRLSTAEERRSRVAAILGTEDGPPRAPLWSPDGLAVACQAGADAQPMVVLAQSGPDPQWELDRPVQMEPGGAMLWSGGRLIVQVAENELGVIERKSVSGG